MSRVNFCSLGIHGRACLFPACSPRYKRIFTQFDHSRRNISLWISRGGHLPTSGNPQTCLFARRQITLSIPWYARRIWWANHINGKVTGCKVEWCLNLLLCNFAAVQQTINLRSTLCRIGRNLQNSLHGLQSSANFTQRAWPTISINMASRSHNLRC